MTDLSVLSLTSGCYNILNWLFVLLENRKFRIGGDVAKQAKDYIFENFAIEYRTFDIIKGYRADDSYFSFATAFLNNTISLSQLERAMLLGKLGEQIVAISEKAFAAFSFIEANQALLKEIFFAIQHVITDGALCLHPLLSCARHQRDCSEIAVP